MIREILTLMIDKVPTQYYIHFTKDRRRFVFQPTLNNKTAPSFILLVSNKEIITEGFIDEKIEEQAKEKVREILSNSIFDQFSED